MCGDHFNGNLLKKCRKKNVAFLKDRAHEKNRCVLPEPKKYNAPLINTHFAKTHKCTYTHARAHIIYRIIYNQV